MNKSPVKGAVVVSSDMTRQSSGHLSGFLFISGIALTVGAILGVIVFLVARSNGQEWALESAERLIAERAQTQSQLFDSIRIDHEAADTVLMERFEALEGIDVDRVFDRLYPLREDGTRRSQPEFFDGYRTEGGAFVEGMGAFIQRGEGLTQEEKRLLIAAFQTVHEFGAGMRGRVDNFYFFTPSNSLVMFAPQREDRLEYYRETAPADFDLQALPFSAMMRPDNNPAGVMACTDLENVVYQHNGPAVSSACGTPVRARGTHLGAFGNSIYLHTWLTQAVIESPEGTNSFVLTADGDVMAHRSLMTLDTLTPDAVAAANRDVDAGAVHAAIISDGRRHGAFIRNGDIVSFARVEASGWHYVSVRPGTAIIVPAMRAALIAGVMSMLLILFGAFGLAANALRIRNRAGEAVSDLLADSPPEEEAALR